MKMSLKQKIAMGLAALASISLLNGCSSGGGGSGGGGGGGGVVIIDPIVYAWFDVYGKGCATATAGPRPGCNFYYSSGSLVKIMDFEDPYFTAQYYNLTFDYYTYLLNGVTYEFTGWAWISPTGIIYDENGNALNQRNGRGRDVIGDIAQSEEEFVEEVGADFAAKHNLTLDRGIQVARALNEWSKIERDRSKTEADVAEFSEKLYGVNYNTMKVALEEAMRGNNDRMRAAVAESAASWGTSEETMKEVLRAWYGRFIPEEIQ